MRDSIVYKAIKKRSALALVFLMAIVVFAHASVASADTYSWTTLQSPNQATIDIQQTSLYFQVSPYSSTPRFYLHSYPAGTQIDTCTGTLCPNGVAGQYPLDFNDIQPNSSYFLTSVGTGVTYNYTNLISSISNNSYPPYLQAQGFVYFSTDGSGDIACWSTQLANTAGTPNFTQCENSVQANILGCTDPIAENYNPSANQDDGSCTYVLGCTDPSANNYNALATQEDGSCTYNPNGNSTTTGAVAYHPTLSSYYFILDNLVSQSIFAYETIEVGEVNNHEAIISTKNENCSTLQTASQCWIEIQSPVNFYENDDLYLYALYNSSFNDKTLRVTDDYIRPFTDPMDYKELDDNYIIVKISPTQLQTKWGNTTYPNFYTSVDTYGSFKRYPVSLIFSADDLSINSLNTYNEAYSFMSSLQVPNSYSYAYNKDATVVYDKIADVLTPTYNAILGNSVDVNVSFVVPASFDYIPAFTTRIEIRDAVTDVVEYSYQNEFEANSAVTYTYSETVDLSDGSKIITAFILDENNQLISEIDEVFFNVNVNTYQQTTGLQNPLQSSASLSQEDCTLYDVGCQFQRALIFLFKPTEAGFSSLKQLGTNIQSRVPFSYYYNAKQKLEDIDAGNGTLSNVTVSAGILGNVTLFNSAEASAGFGGQQISNFSVYINYALWFFFLIWVYRRVLDLWTPDS